MEPEESDASLPLSARLDSLELAQRLALGVEAGCCVCANLFICFVLSLLDCLLACFVLVLLYSVCVCAPEASQPATEAHEQDAQTEVEAEEAAPDYQEDDYEEDQVIQYDQYDDQMGFEIGPQRARMRF